MAITRYARLRMLLEVSEFSDYARSQTEELTDEVTSTRVVQKVGTATTGGITEDLALMTSVERAVIYNHDTTNYIDISYTNGGTASNAQVTAESAVVIQNPTIANDLVLTADSASCDYTMWLLGTE